MARESSTDIDISATLKSMAENPVLGEICKPELVHMLIVTLNVQWGREEKEMKATNVPARKEMLCPTL